MISGSDLGGFLLGLVDVYRWTIGLYASLIFDGQPFDRAGRRVARGAFLRLIVGLAVILVARPFLDCAALGMLHRAAQD